MASFAEGFPMDSTHRSSRTPASTQQFPDFLADESCLGDVMKSLISSNGLQQAWVRISKRLKIVEESLSSVEVTCRSLPQDYSSAQRIDALEARLDARCEAHEAALRRFEEPFAEVVGWCTREKRAHLDKCVLINDELASLKARATNMETAHEALKAELDQRLDAVHARIEREKAELLSELAAQDEKHSTHMQQMRADLEAADLQSREFAGAEARRTVCHAFGIDDAESSVDGDEAEPEAEADDAEGDGLGDSVSVLEGDGLDTEAQKQAVEDAEGNVDSAMSTAIQSPTANTDKAQSQANGNPTAEQKASANVEIEGDSALTTAKPPMAIADRVQSQTAGNAMGENERMALVAPDSEKTSLMMPFGSQAEAERQSMKNVGSDFSHVDAQPVNGAALHYLETKMYSKSFTRAQRHMMEVVSEQLVIPAITRQQADLDHHKEVTQEIAYNTKQTNSILRRQMGHVEKNVQEVQRIARDLWKEIEQCTRKTETNILEDVINGTIRELSRGYESEHYKVLAKFQEMVDHFAKVHHVLNDHEHLLRHHAEELENRCNKYYALLLQTQLDRCIDKSEKLDTSVDKLRKDADGLHAKLDGMKAVVKAKLKLKGVSAMGRASRNSTTGSSASGFSDWDVSKARRGSTSVETLPTAASLSVNASAASLQDLVEGNNEEEDVEVSKGDALREISTELGFRETDSQDEDLFSEGFGAIDDDSSQGGQDPVDGLLPRQAVQHAQLEMIACGLCALGMLCFRSPSLGQSRQARMDMEKEVLADLRSLRQWVSRNTVPVGWDPKRLMSRVLTDDMAVPPPPVAPTPPSQEPLATPRRHMSGDSSRRHASADSSQTLPPPATEVKPRVTPNLTCRGDGAVKTTVMPPKLIFDGRGPKAGSGQQKHPLSARTPRSADLGAGGPQLPCIL